VNVPPTFVEGVLSYVDLDLDILVEPDFSYRILDRDDFEQSVELYRYPEEVQTNALSAVDELVAMIEARQFPFNDQHL
jgi:protein associated with RNAse G/E